MKKEKDGEEEIGFSENIDNIVFEYYGIHLSAIVEPNFKVVNGRRVVIDKQRKLLLTKQEIFNNRKADLDKIVENFIGKVDNKRAEDIAEAGPTRANNSKYIGATYTNTIFINGRRVKRVRKAKKLDNSHNSFKTKSNAMKDNKNNHLCTNSDKNNTSQLSLQMAWPHPMLMKPRIARNFKS